MVPPKCFFGYFRSNRAERVAETRSALFFAHRKISTGGRRAGFDRRLVTHNFRTRPLETSVQWHGESHFLRVLCALLCHYLRFPLVSRSLRSIATMPECLIALGSNVGDRSAALNAAVAALRSMPQIRATRQSDWHRTRPVGGTALRGQFLNGALLIETSHEPEDVLEILQQVESRQGRAHHKRWADRTLDLDLLLYGDCVINSPRLTVPHPRMSFRRFVLEPAAEIAGEMIHPIIGWSLDQLRQHLDVGSDSIAIMSPNESIRLETIDLVTAHGAMSQITVANEPSHLQFWPAELTSWVSVRTESSHLNSFARGFSSDHHPKLTILVDPVPASDEKWNTITRQPGRGPTLHVGATNRSVLSQEVWAAVQAVWLRLGP